MPHGMIDPNSLVRGLKKIVYGHLIEWPNLRRTRALLYTHEEERRLAESALRNLPAGFIVPLGCDDPPSDDRATCR